MSDKNNNSEWDIENAERRPGVKNPRAIVSVAFARQEFESVKECAEQQGKRVSQFIREAALEKVEQRNRVTSVEWQGTGYGSFLVNTSSGLSTHGTVTRTNGVETETETAQGAST